jgi:hypothetical protein
MQIIRISSGKKKIKLSRKEWLEMGKTAGWMKTVAYGDKRNFPKIEIFVDGEYKATTTWAKTCKEAKEKFLEQNPNISASQVKCSFKK